MKKAIVICFMVICGVFCMTGCQGNSAEKMKEDGVWAEKNMIFSMDDAGRTTIKLTFNVKKDMTEKDMLEVLDYYKSEVFVNDPEALERVMPCEEEDYNVPYKVDTTRERDCLKTDYR